RVSQQLDYGPFELADARAHVLRDEADDVVRNCSFEIILLRFLLQDRDSVLEIGELDIGDHPPLKAAYESGLESRYVGGRAIARENYLAASFIQRVESVKELLLSALLSLQEVHIVDEKEISFAITAPELVVGPSLDCVDHFVGELFSSNEGDACGRVALVDGVPYGLHEMGLSEAGIAVDEKWVVDLSRSLSDCMCGRGRELVGFADYKLRKSVSIVKWRLGGALRARSCRCFFGFWGYEEIHLGA